MTVFLVIKSLLLATSKDDNDLPHTFMPWFLSILSLSISAVNTKNFTIDGCAPNRNKIL